MKYQARVKKPRVTADPGTRSEVHPSDAPRAASGPKGDGWVVSLPGTQAAPGTAIVAVGTGRDSTTIVIGEAHGSVPRVHPTHDLGIVIPEGTGELRHGSAPGGLVSERYAGPCTLVIPARTWHAVVPDPGSGPLTAFFTRPGQVIDPFSVVGPRAEPGLVHLDTLPVSPWPMLPAEVVDVPSRGHGAAGPVASASATSASFEATRPARIVTWDPPVGDAYTLPLDTGSDTLFVMSSVNRSWDRAPVDVPVHRHDREDEFIVLGEGAQGWLLNGATLESVERIPFTGPCVLVMPSGDFHRVVRTEDVIVRSILVYAHRAQVTASWEGIVAEMVMEESAA